MLQTPLESKKEILGYQLQERIGSGGFGEVWSAIAPGGLMKAVKVVYGFHDGRRAKAEMKALDRVKELRHPFLLSLERIEVFEGQLVVISELADGSLANLFNEFITKGEPGIPRDDMLKYIRCAAEALDYLSDEHRLQHLDVKPENLLMVGSHVKVADFGLIKDLQNASQSLMSGMTPAYAAPELFDGRPVSSSDQYSLAIVYQEMLTGIRPFPGSTPAQLAAQHMHGRPNLRSLSKSDQPIIAKALSKDPSCRFQNCREMAEELTNRRRVVKKAIRRQDFRRDDNSTESKTIHIGNESLRHDVTAVITERSLPFQAAEIKVLDPPECSASDTKLRPTLMLGVGATGSKIVQKLKSRLVARHGSMEEIPSVRLLCLDSDRELLGTLRRTKGQGSLTNREAIEVPLRKPEGYRGSNKSHLNWLSRRWIYNVPRSLQTEGLRPLGRLAFADHFETICEQLQSTFREMTTPENLAKTADTLDIDPGELAPRVFIVTSVSGGVGSGMALDLAYTVKMLMHECGLAADSVGGILLHSTYQRSRDPGLSAANSFAFLTEMRHFVENGFPGDPSIGLPDFDEIPPFDFTYFNDLGNDLCHSEFEDRLDRIAEYLSLASTSRCAPFFDKCRELEEELDHFALRTFGLSITGPGNFSAGIHAVQGVGRGLIRRWLSVECEGFESPEVISKKLVDKLDVSNNKVVAAAQQQTQVEFRETLQTLKTEAFASLASGNVKLQLAGSVDKYLGCPLSQRDSGYVDTDLCQKLETWIGNKAQADGEKMLGEIQSLMGGRSMNLALTRDSARAAVAALKDFSKNLESATQTAASKQFLDFLDQVPPNKLADPQDERVQGIVNGYIEQRFLELHARLARTYYRIILSSLDSTLTMLDRFYRQVESVSHEFANVDEIANPLIDSDRLNMDQLLNESIGRDLVEHIKTTESQVFESLIQDRGGYIEALNETSVWQNQLAFEIRMQAQRVLADAYKKVSLEKVLMQNSIEPERLVKWLNEKMMEARPIIDDCGGASRLLVGLPTLSEDTQVEAMLKDRFDINCSALRGTQGNFVMCFEGEDITLANVAYRLLQARPDAIELVKRIQTRKDVDWTTLDDLL